MSLLRSTTALQSFRSRDMASSLSPKKGLATTFLPYILIIEPAETSCSAPASDVIRGSNVTRGISPADSRGRADSTVVEMAKRTVWPIPRQLSHGRSATSLSSGPVVTAGLWAVIATLAGIINADLQVPSDVRLIVASLLLFTAGRFLAAWVARPLTLRASLKLLKLGPWICVGYSIVFGLATLIWSTPARLGDIGLDRNLFVTAGYITFAGLLALLVGYRLTPTPLIRGISSLDELLRGTSRVGPLGTPFSSCGRRRYSGRRSPCNRSLRLPLRPERGADDHFISQRGAGPTHPTRTAQ